MLTGISARNPACDVACSNSTLPGNIGVLAAGFWFDGIEVERRPVAVLAVFFQFALRVHPLHLARAPLDPAPFLDFLHALILPRWHPRSTTLPAAFGVLVVRTLSRSRPSMVPEATAMDQRQRVQPRTWNSRRLSTHLVPVEHTIQVPVLVHDNVKANGRK